MWASVRVRVAVAGLIASTVPQAPMVRTVIDYRQYRETIIRCGPLRKASGQGLGLPPDADTDWPLNLGEVHHFTMLRDFHGAAFHQPGGCLPGTVH